MSGVALEMLFFLWCGKEDEEKTKCGSRDVYFIYVRLLTLCSKQSVALEMLFSLCVTIDIVFETGVVAQTNSTRTRDWCGFWDDAWNVWHFKGATPK